MPSARSAAAWSNRHDSVRIWLARVMYHVYTEPVVMGPVREAYREAGCRSTGALQD